MDSLEQFIDTEINPNTPLARAAKLCFDKLQEYYVKSDDSPIPMVALCKYSTSLLKIGHSIHRKDSFN
jgi:hypothetical protein